MIHHLDDVRQGFDVDADVVVVGTGASGAVAARNFAEAGLRTVVLEAGPQVRPEDMTRDAPAFLSRYYWEGGLRLIDGKAKIPSMQGRCLGGSTVVNSAIMLKLPRWVRDEWIAADGLDGLADPALDRAFERVFRDTRTAPTPMSVMGPRNLVARDALEAMGIPSKALPRAVDGCKGCADCLVGCAEGAKQSTDRSYIPVAVAAGASVYTCCHVDEVTTEGTRATGVLGRVIDPDGRRVVGSFRVRASRVVLAAGVMATPVILQRSRINPRGQIGGSLYAHLSGGMMAVMEERIDPWVGATQGWGAISTEIRGMKFESLWASPSVMLVKWGGMGVEFLRNLETVKHLAIIAIVYRGACDGSVRARRNGLPKMRMRIPDAEARVVFRGMKIAADGMLKVGARYATTAPMTGVPDKMYTPEDTEAMLSRRCGTKDLTMTGNHVFGSCRMSADPKRGPVDPQGRLRGVEGVWIVDTSIFPSPSAVNPQATVMALSDVITRRIAELAA